MLRCPDHLENSIISPLHAIIKHRHTHMHIHTTNTHTSVSCLVSQTLQRRESWPGGIDLRTGVIGFLRCVATLSKVTARMNATDTTPPNRSIFLCVCQPAD